MAGAETQRPTPVVDRGLSAWQTWNKLTLTVGVGAVAGGILFSLPGLAMVGAVSATVDGVQMSVISEVQKKRKTQTMKPGEEYTLAA